MASWIWTPHQLTANCREIAISLINPVLQTNKRRKLVQTPVYKRPILTLNEQ